MTKYDVAVVGGGIAGLTAAVYAAKAGKRTILIDKQGRFGGRAMSTVKQGVTFNMGGHALYFGDAYDTFRELGLSLKGSKPSIDAHGIWKDKCSVLPTGAGSLMATPLLTWKGKMELAGWLAKLTKLDTSRYDRISLREWIEGNVHDPMLRNIFYSLLRTASYAAAPDLQAAGPVLKQFQAALRGVLYLDRGWGTMADELRELASKHGVRLLTNCKAVSIEHEDGAVRQVRCEDGTVIEAENVIATAPPAALCRLVPNAEATALARWNAQAIEVTAACLDVALRKLPEPKRQFVYGIDRPVFLTNQSRAARLSDNGEQVVCLIKYQSKETDAKQDLQDLEHTLDLVQPGWRDELVVKQFLPKITVCHDFVHIRREECPGPAVPEIKGLYVAGDWASHGELLVDAATASAKRAVRTIPKIEQMKEAAL
ncbi:phytoene desaturase family protein [Paenibacillus thailandensis]|uniref:Phytoene desaturase family protein n=1 Tax=Paenibacillus thailandensis TaxID=393250 RepID=A0ABW5R2B8_9BACL